MQTYEIFLTNKCTRNCSFCDIPKSDFISSDCHIQKFIDYVKSNTNILSKFSINFFGGEPLLCCNDIYKICNAFKDYPYCKFIMTTNGDLIDKLDKTLLPTNFLLSVSAYDIFTNIDKYVKIQNALQPFQIAFRFTFDESSIDRINEFKSICLQNKLLYRIVFSHAKKSWASISIEKMKNTLYKFYQNELNDFYRSASFDPPSSIFQQFTRFVQLLFDKNMQDFFCITDSKVVFYEGENIGPCIRLNGIKSHIYPIKCESCKYKMCCSKGCVAEYYENDIDEKLCLINKIAFECIEELFCKHQNSTRLIKILSYIIRNLL